MTREELDAIRARMEAGTARGLSTQVEIDRDGTTRWMNLGPYPCATHEDAAQVRDIVTFVHAAPTDLRALLAEVERLQIEASHYLANLGTAEILKSSWQRERERLQKLLSDAGDAMRKARVENKFLRERNRRDEAVSLLAEQEWITDGRECLVYCIHCGQPESKGHDEYCRAFGREGIVTGCLEEKAELTARFEALMDEIDAATKVTP